MADDKIRTSKWPESFNGPCFACKVNGVEGRATYVVLPPMEASSDSVGLSSCRAHLEQSQRMVTLYADDLDKITRILTNATKGGA